ncbi:SAF domain-containing protein [Actinomadura chokoriensis]|uniref:SAF domain-containing protein n=1 Tax=Actinomadura chokoriensis TaxID=454156 RepID=A0ABV4R849_9ACTN
MKSSGGTLPKPTVPKLTGGPVPASSRRLARQRRPRWIVAGMVLLVFAMVANVYLFRSAGERMPVVRLARDVPVGQELVQADLDVVRVATDSAVATIPQRQLPEVIGQRAAVGLRKGTLLAASQLTAQQSPQRGQALVTVPLKAGAVPPGLAPGWLVRVVFTPGEQGADAGSVQSHPGTGVLRDVTGVIEQVESPDTEGAVTVSLLVADSDSSTVARQAAAGSVVLVVTERRG